MLSFSNSQDILKTTVIAVLIVVQTFLFSFVARRILFYLFQKWKYPKQTFLEDYYGHIDYCKILFLSMFLSFITYIYVKDIPTFLLSSLFVIVSSFLISVVHLFNSEDIDLVKSQTLKTSIGALWAHGAFKAYFEVIFKEWYSVIKEYEVTGKQLTSKKLILICPLSCNNQGKLSERFEDIEEIGLVTFTAFDQGANINRDYKSPIYKLGTQDNEIFITAQFPSSFGTLWKVKDTLKKDVWLYHRDSFISTLKELLKDSPCIFFEYNDLDVSNREPLDKFLLSQLNLKKEK